MTIPYTRTLISSAIIGTTLGTLSPAASAQGAALEEVVVTATRRAASVQDVPYNISALSGDDLNEAGINSAADLFRVTTGVNFIEQGPRSGVNNANLIIRGINAEVLSRNQGPMQTAPVVSTYINETPLFANLRLKDIERVEVLRGPQGTLYGSGSLGGSVRYIYNKPDPSALYGEVSGGLGQTKNGDGMNYEGDLMLNLPLGERFALRANVGYEKDAGFIDQVARYARHPDGSPVLDNGATDPFGDSANFFAGQPVFESKDGVNDAETESYRLAAAWDVTDRLTLDASYHHQSDDVGGTQMNSYELFGDDSLKNASLIAEPFERDVDVLALDAEFDMGFATFTASASKYQSEGEGSRDLTGFYELFSFWEAYYGNSPRPLIEDVSRFNDEGEVFEARLVSNGDGPIDWVVGAFYMEQDTELSARQYYYGYDDYANACFIETGTFGGSPCGLGTLWGLQDFNGPVPIVKDEAYLVDQQNTFTDQALFGELTWHITEQWQVTGGVRYYDQEFETTQTGGLEFVPGGIESRNLDSSDSDSLFKVNTSYYLNDSTNLYAVWSEGFRRGGANGLPNEAFGAAINDKAFLYAPDTTENIEVGVKGSLADRYTYSVAYYDISWDNMQSNLSCTGLGLLCVVNVGEASSRGLEAELKGRVTDNLEMQVAYTYNDTELESLSDTLQEFIADGTSFVAVEPGVSLPGAADNSLYLAATYYQNLANGMELVYNLNGSYRDETESSLEVTSITLDSFWLWNAGIGLNRDMWSVRAFVNNLADERGLTAADSAELWGPRANAIVSTPRTFGISARYQF
ncbi:TonB-dependent receptor [Parahaliea aestuarii]|uniref:TonB-dependent receptor plug domain-containing protein n=1 Tax=Parahaliea aestuarii TaxID=1852021 RepID=A0A5C8ZUY0_9GAMM|nr:TonB-dependent receptor [Parahaliea aestuarii]TXS91564.1 TonB-dependent receptor plug domain-containing protein [Parahaliea aestuarii]